MSLHDARRLPPTLRGLLGRLGRGEIVPPHAALPRVGRRRLTRIVVALVSFAALIACWAELAFDLTHPIEGFAYSDEGQALAVVAAVLGLAFGWASLGAMAIARSTLRPMLVASPTLWIATGYDDEPVRAVPIGDAARVTIEGDRVVVTIDGTRIEARAETTAEARAFVARAESLARSPDTADAPDWRNDAPAPRVALGPIVRVLVSPVFGALAGAIAIASWFYAFSATEARTFVACPEDDRCFEYDGVHARAINTWPADWLARTPLEAHEAIMQERSDDASWRYASSLESPYAVREYLANGETTRHRADALARLGTLYDARIAQLHADAASAGGDPVLTAGMESALRWLATDTTSADMALRFLPAEGIDDTSAWEAALAALTGSERVEPVAPSFDATRNLARETTVREAVVAAFQPFGGYAFALDSLDRTRPRILVHYRVEPSGAAYVDTSEEALPPAERHVYVGIRIVFDCTIQVPTTPGEELADDATEGSSVQFVVEPAADFSVTGALGDDMTSRIYDRMAETAFDALQQRLTRALGARGS